jgi:signal transduction histidine kinase
MMRPASSGRTVVQDQARMVDRLCRILLVVVLLLLPVLAWPARAWQAASDARDGDNQPSILFLAVDDFTRPYIRLMFEAFTDTVSAAQSAPAIYFESLDASRFQEPHYLDDLREWLRRKYSGRHIDLIMPIAEDALGFLADARGEPWPTAQVLYFESGNVRAELRRALPQAGGMELEDTYSTAMKVAKTVLPERTHMAVVYGASNVEIVRWRNFAEMVRKTGFEPIELIGRTMEETRTALTRLPAQTVVTVLAPIVDANGNVLQPYQVCEQIAAAGMAPTIMTEVHHLGCGAVGGVMRDWTIIGRLLAEEAMARLKSPSTDVITVPAERFTILAFDARQLERWSIPERRLPAGSDVRFRAPSLWRDRRGLVLAALGVTLLQSLLIAGLVFERRRRRRAEIDSRRHLAAMAHLDRRAAMGELATSLAHELNQPLNAILQNAGVAEMMLTKPAQPQERDEMLDIITDIRKDDIRASEIIRRMRGLLQKHELESQVIDLNQIAEETVTIVRPDARARQVQLEVALGDDLPSILGDRVHLQQVMLNVLINALDAVSTLPPDRRRVRVRSRREGNDVRVSVTDTGVGIRGARTSEIFEPFFTTKREGSGMGMGLAIARSIIEAHAGRMAAENNPSGGATVWFSVPISPRPSTTGAAAD